MDVAIAERVMGLVPCTAYFHTLNADHEFCHAQPDSADQGGETKCYSSEIAAAMEVEDRIAELGLINGYIVALWTNRDRSVNFWTRTNMESFWAAIHATPEQRCRAALATVENKTTHEQELG